MEKLKLVMIGNGMAGVRTLEELLKLAPDLYEIAVFGAEPHPNYNRILLSPVLAGEQTFEEIVLNDLDWYRDNGIDLRLGCKVVDIDRENRRVTASDGSQAEYDRLLVATGSSPFILPIPGKDLQGVIGYRDIADTRAMMETARSHRHALVIGGGLLGLEAANGLRLRGMEVTVVHLGDWLLDRQLDRTAGKLLQNALEARGIKFRLNTNTAALLDDGQGRVASAHFSDGEECPADLVVMAAGIRPNVELAERAGLACDRGIRVDDYLRTADPAIYAVGECANHRGIAYGLVAPLFEQARVCADHLARLGNARYEGSVTSTKLKVTGIDLFSAGDFMGGEGTETITFSDPIGGVYKKLVVKDDVLVGACLYGDTADGGWYFRQIREQHNVAEIRDLLMFGENAIGDAGHQGQDKAMAMSDEMEVCGCNGVCKGTIVKAIRENGLLSVDEVKKHTKAASSCGSCARLVEQILINTVGGAADVKPKSEKPVCGCTDLNHGQVRQAIREQRLTGMGEAMKAMEWRSPDGCATCRPALNYYLISTWPGEAKDDPQSRLINERAHANIQKDGTYSVVPRMWGGVTSPAELRRIADVAEKYKVPMVKVTGGQRIDLLGVKKEDLPNVWRELGMPSGHAYGKSIRTVKTCVGSEFCRFGTQNSTQMGIDLEHALFGMWSPHKVKLAVSGCPRNCAESGIKDVGVIGVDSGWEIYIGGNGGIKTEAGEFFVKVGSAGEVMEYSLAFLQLYREEAFYLERTVHYLHRVGLEHIRQAVLEDGERRKALHQRLLFALSFEQDPWQQQIGNPALKKEFERIPVRETETA
ncbi:Assimilatory Nitrite reductase,large subunit; NasA [Azotobacter vinelandii CA]|uniref:Assimilatory Nitrite reductase,large subunit NasA n=2 Tax=Azotobacter vinelandii TaxID=354 RepID=C1DHD0_AZOVD|nr:nitrite reductase large subunit NirB [Azotobacter vinelandii]ACO78525.1 Assimilatory Nitrite reductase,large subunit; NasA [Azotobacter vinelandii DJ]AGK13763.1 Assimilatory Nitrite reductase,large subunit; NasA [Azotobacter vinelandii CA]AGK18363.1 Assimilatory Nitrite reductase,large subunit; NasA [Azotobacter vinelandii CA6]SFX59781.1 nitrite reductase (NADH) large subunit [Azotobacter vinelandii]GLK61565.1 nitrite reductase large subunit [Azotobacter vinelandii]